MFSGSHHGLIGCMSRCRGQFVHIPRPSRPIPKRIKKYGSEYILYYSDESETDHETEDDSSDESETDHKTEDDSSDESETDHETENNSRDESEIDHETEDDNSDNIDNPESN